VLATLPGLNGFAQILRATWTKKHGPFSDDDHLQDEDLANKLEEGNLPRGRHRNWQACDLISSCD
jgi:hypothetical protein